MLRFWRWSLPGIIGLLVAIGAVVLPLRAQLGRPATPQVVQTRHATAHQVTIIVLDMSGSMGTNDPDGLRCSAAGAYIDLSRAGDAIGVVGLANQSGVTGGSHNFQLAQDWAQPADMAVLSARQSLKASIAKQSGNCAPNGGTPTYDALAKAYAMLTKSVTANQQGSVILLTDGIPAPDTDVQVAAIRNELVPQFKQHNWPVNTVALGEDTDGFHPFLQNVANATSGGFYDDGKGEVPGVSPLNIAPFFVQIFGKQHPDHTVKREIPNTTVSDTPRANFSVSDYANNLDVILVRETGDVAVSLRTPNGVQLGVNSGGINVYKDTHYVIFSIDAPLSGIWELDVSGSGRYVVYSSKISRVSLSFVTPDDQTPTQALGGPITISAQLFNAGSPITDNRFQITGTIAFAGGGQAATQQFTMTADPANPGTFTVTVTIPFTAPTGTYIITIFATGNSGDDVISSTQRSIRVQLFPAPLFFRNQGSDAAQSPTPDPVEATVIRWDPILQAIYSPGFFIIPWLADHALQNHPARPSANLRGAIYVGGNRYTKARVMGTAVRDGTNDTVPIRVVNDGNGQFHVLFPALISGTYTVTFQTSGDYVDSHGDFAPMTRQVHLVVQDPPTNLVYYAWAWTIAYLLIALFLIFFSKNRATSTPHGTWVGSSDSGDAASGDFLRIRRRGFLQSFFARNTVFSEQVGMPQGLRFIFHWGGMVRVTPHGKTGTLWHNTNGDAMPPRMISSGEFVFLEREAEPQTYSISTGKSTPDSNGYDDLSGSWETEADYDQPRSRKRRMPSFSRAKRTRDTSNDEDYF